MSRYIDSDKLKNKMFSYYDCVNSNTLKDNYKGETLMNYEVADMIEDCIDNAPIVDVQEVKHAKWELLNKNQSRCSNCGLVRNIETQVGWKFCPICGARFNLEEEK